MEEPATNDAARIKMGQFAATTRSSRLMNENPVFSVRAPGPSSTISAEGNLRIASLPKAGVSRRQEGNRSRWGGRTSNPVGAAGGPAWVRLPLSSAISPSPKSDLRQNMRAIVIARETLYPLRLQPALADLPIATQRTTRTVYAVLIRRDRGPDCPFAPVSARKSLRRRESEEGLGQQFIATVAPVEIAGSLLTICLPKALPDCLVCA